VTTPSEPSSSPPRVPARRQWSRGDDFRSGALLAVNLGDDADTTGAIYGQLAGAHYGVDGIPAHWLAALAKRDQVELLASRLATEEE
jgi:ADP-ribosyl-[dinitrogen reductase] hydrolase